MSSSCKLSRAIVKELASYGVVLQSLSSSRDLGVTFTGGKHRAPALLNKRILTSKSVNIKVSSLAKVTRRARKLFTSGVYPQATWGHECIGFSPTQSKALRRMCANSTGVASAGRCCTTTIFVSFGRRGGPLQRAMKETITEWFELLLLLDTPLLIAQLNFAWAKAKTIIVDQTICKSKPKISKVYGVITNVLYLLYLYGWVPHRYNVWSAPNGEQWSFPATGFPFQHVIVFCFAGLHRSRPVEECLCSSLWERP